MRLELPQLDVVALPSRTISNAVFDLSKDLCKRAYVLLDKQCSLLKSKMTKSEGIGGN